MKLKKMFIDSNDSNNLLKDEVEGKIKKIHSDDVAYYETIKEEHYHFECCKCKNVIDIDPKYGATIAYLKSIQFDPRICVYDDEQIKYAVRMALKTY